MNAETHLNVAQKSRGADTPIITPGDPDSMRSSFNKRCLAFVLAPLLVQGGCTLDTMGDGASNDTDSAVADHSLSDEGLVLPDQNVSESEADNIFTESDLGDANDGGTEADGSVEADVSADTGEEAATDATAEDALTEPVDTGAPDAGDVINEPPAPVVITITPPQDTKYEAVLFRGSNAVWQTLQNAGDETTALSYSGVLNNDVLVVQVKPASGSEAGASQFATENNLNVSGSETARARGIATDQTAALSEFANMKDNCPGCVSVSNMKSAPDYYYDLKQDSPFDQSTIYVIEIQY